MGFIARREIEMKNILWIVVTAGLIACGQKKEESNGDIKSQDESNIKSESSNRKAASEASSTAIKGTMSLFVTASTFKANDQGKFTVPDRAVMLILKAAGGKWNVEQIEDTESNVFHKALPFGENQILTIGGNRAILKLWSKSNGKWTSETLWNPTFGGKQNRLRDFESADFDGDGKEDLAIATHDQGVVAAVFQRDGKWEPMELDRTPDTFVHEVEVGDLDKNGKLEIYATPSAPNTVSGKDQGGKILRFEWNGNAFDKSVVASFDKRHVKEVYVKDVDGDGKDELYAAVEAEVDGPTIIAPVEIRRYDLVDGKFASASISTLDDRFCRFLTSGDLDKDGKNELVAAAFSTGVTLFKREGDTYSKKTIDPDSGGFEHAAYVVDLDKDGTPELYVADDKGGTINRFVEKNGVFEKQVIYKRDNPTQAMVWNITHADF
jgi:hypothetical protein